jgi:hypothetical protein
LICSMLITLLHFQNVCMREDERGSYSPVAFCTHGAMRDVCAGPRGWNSLQDYYLDSITVLYDVTLWYLSIVEGT